MATVTVKDCGSPESGRPQPRIPVAGDVVKGLPGPGRRKELVKELAPGDPAGVTSIGSIHVTPDGRSFAYSYDQNLSDLYVVEGLK